MVGSCLGLALHLCSTSIGKVPAGLRRRSAISGFNRLFCRLQNGNIVAIKPAGPKRRFIHDVNGVMQFVEHLVACDCGAIVHDVGGRGLYDREAFVSFRSAFFEV
ncbi:hypothetical protein MUO69_07165 [Candidatus Bathyarchaeota archaeon]|nr:hypothetical protein [Candidatus Bathyarchaeota archaeon]